MDFCTQIQGKPEWFEAANTGLAEVVTAVRRTNMKGELILRLKIAPSIDRDGNTIVTQALDVKTSCPRHSPGLQTAYVITDQDGNAVELSKDHPAQTHMFEQMKAEMKEN